MAFGKKEGKPLPAISTASLPDIIFILLFFFMVATVMRTTELKVKVKVPGATELEKLERKSLVSYIYVGFPAPDYVDRFGTAPAIQLNDVIYSAPDGVDQIQQFVVNERNKLDEKLQGAMMISMRVDEDVKMGVVTDVKQELRDALALKVNYSAVGRQEY